MLISFFKSNHPIAVLVALPLLVALLWLPGIIRYPMPLVFDNPMPLYAAVSYLCSLVPYSAPVLGLVLVYVQAMRINNLVNNHDLLRPKSSLPALFYVVLMSSFTELQTLHPVLLANLFLVFALDRISTVFNQKAVFSQVFDAGMLIAFGSFFYFPAIAFFVFLWISLVIIRPFIWREYIIAAIGLAVPYLFLWTWYFWKGGWQNFFVDKISEFDPASIVFPDFSTSDYVLVFFFLLILLFSLMVTFKSMGHNVVRVQYLLRTIMAFLFIGFAILLFDKSKSLFTMAMVAIPASILMANFFLHLKRPFFSEMVFAAVLALAAYNILFA